MRTPVITLALLVAALSPIPSAAKPLVWKSAVTAFLRVNDQPPKEWAAFQIEKKNDRFLLQIGERYLLIDAEMKQVFDLQPATISRSGSDLLWDPDNRPAKPLATSNWIVRNVGEALRIKMQLDAEDRTLDLQLPHPPSRY